MDRQIQQPLARGTESLMWIDPDDAQGVLLSDRIEFYSKKVALIAPFDARRLGPASYDLTLGPECWTAQQLIVTGDLKRTLLPGERLIVEPNSIVYITSAERLTLPFYLVGHFNLKLRFLHEGLLVGAGPQIDPGFVGRLSCPLHNVSNQRVSLTLGEPFAVVEFQKTTRFAELHKWRETETLAAVRERGEAGDLKGLEYNSCLTFPSRSLDREPVKRYVPTGRLVTSSLQGLKTGLDNLTTSVNRRLGAARKEAKQLSLVGYLSVVTIVISLVACFVAMTSFYRFASDNAFQALEQLKTNEVARARLEERVQELEREVQRLAAKVGPKPVNEPRAH